MKHTLTTIVLAALCLSMNAQEDNAAVHKLQLGLHMTNNAASRFKTRFTDPTPMYGFDVGMDARWNVSRLIGLETGITYSKKGHKYYMDNLVFDPLNPVPVGSVTTRYNYHYLSIPVKVLLTAGKGKLRFTSGIGVSADLLLSQNYTMTIKMNDETDINKYTSTVGFNRVIVSAIAQAGIDYKLSDRLNLTVLPVFNVNLLSTHPGPWPERLWTAGISTGIYYGF